MGTIGLGFATALRDVDAVAEAPVPCLRHAQAYGSNPAVVMTPATIVFQSNRRA